LSGGSVIAPRNPLPVAPGATEVADLFVVLSPDAFHDGEHPVQVRVDDGSTYHGAFSHRLVGPEHREAASHKKEKEER
jgi:hypothetical protein